MKYVDIPSKTASLQCSWVKRVFDRNLHEQKIIPFFLFEKYFGKSFKFHQYLNIPQYLIRKMAEFYREILLNLSKFLCYHPSVPSTILSQYLWFNNSVYFSHFLNHGINFTGNLVDINGKYKSWDVIKY